nr:hypothetical protein [Tanacetum cinerariifolium]
MGESLFRQFRGEKIKIRGTMLEELVQQPIEEYITELGMQIKADECNALDSDIGVEPTARPSSWKTFPQLGQHINKLVPLMHLHYLRLPESLLPNKAKRAQPALYDGHEILKTNHVPAIATTSEEDLKLAEISREKMIEKVKDLESLVKEVRAMKAVFKNIKAEVDQNAIDKKCDTIERKNLLITNENLIVNCIAQEVFYTVTDSVFTASRFHELKVAYDVEKSPAVKLEAENSKLLEKIQNDDHDSMVKHFSKLEIDHLNLQLKYQHVKENIGNSKSKTSKDAPEFDAFFELNKRNDQLQAHKNTIRKLKDQISQLKVKNGDVVGTFDHKSLDSQNIQLKETVTALHERIESYKSENEKVKRHYQELFDSIKYAIDVEPTPNRIRNNREVHLDYLKHLKESVETLCAIVEEAKVERPLDRPLESACLYTKHS